MNNNLIELAKLIFEGEPKDPNSIQMQYEDYNSIEDIFEVLLHIFIYVNLRTQKNKYFLILYNRFMTIYRIIFHIFILLYIYSF